MTHVGVDLKLPAVRTGVFERPDEQLYPGGVHELKPGEVDPNGLLGGGEFAEAVTKASRRRQIEFAFQIQPAGAAWIEYVDDLKVHTKLDSGRLWQVREGEGEVPAAVRANAPSVQQSR